MSLPSLGPCNGSSSSWEKVGAQGPASSAPAYSPTYPPLFFSSSFGFGKRHLCRLTPTCLQVLGSHTISSGKLSRPSLYLSHRTLSHSVFRYPMQNLPACLPRVPILPSDCESPHQHLNQSWVHDRDSINIYI